MNPPDLTDVRLEPSYTNHLRALERLKAAGALSPAGSPRVVVLSDFTIEPLVSCLSVRAHLEGMPIRAEVCPPQDLARTILEPGGVLYEGNPDVVLVVVSPEAILADAAGPSLADEAANRSAVQRALAQYCELLGALRARSNATVLVANLVSPVSSPLGLLDWQIGSGVQRAIEELNHGLADWLRQSPRMFLVDLAGMCASAGLDQTFDRRMSLLAHQPFATGVLPRLAAGINRYLMAVIRPPRKCLILDLDHTLWGGVLAEEGSAGLRLGHDAAGTAYRDFQRVILALHQRGVLLAICSRNDESEARAVLRDHPEMVLRPEHFAAYRIGWVDKAQSIAAIADELNIGLDSMVFLDDDPFERQNVHDRLPDVLVPELPADPVQYRAFLLGLSAFDTLHVTTEDLSRGRMYHERSSREALQATAKSLDEYLTDLQMEIDAVEPTGAARQRLFQLVHKTNRFNLTTRRYTEAEFDTLINGSQTQVFGVRVRDRLGDNGIVGLAVLRFERDVCEIETFLLSCRVLGRSIETAVLVHAADSARARGAVILQGRFVPSAKNGLVADLYARHGLTLAAHEGDAQLWRAPLDEALREAPPWARVRTGQDEVSAR